MIWNPIRLLPGSLAFLIGCLVANGCLSLCAAGEERGHTLSRVRAIGQLFWVLWPHECPNPDTEGLFIVHDTFLEFFWQGIDPLEPGFFETRLLGLLGVVSDSPDDAGHLGDFMHATSKTNSDDLLYGPGFSRS